jgi:hypothetical protein
MSSVYQINKGVGKPIVFRGLKGPWIGCLFCGLAGLVVLFAVAYITGVPLPACVIVVISLGIALFLLVYRLNHRYSEHGIMKNIAYRSMPKWIRFDRPLQL